MLRLSDIIKHTKKFFEKKRKNPIQLENDSNLESNLKFLKVSDKSTPIQISDDTINVQGSLTVNGDSVQTGTDAGATALDELSDVTYSSGDLTISSLDTIVTSGDLNLSLAGSAIFTTAGRTDFFVTGNTDDYGRIAIGGNGEMTIATTDAAGADAHMILAADGAITLDAEGDIEVNADGGEITFKDRTVTIAEFSTTTSNSLTIYNAGGVSDYCEIKVGNKGETTISTQDSTDADSGHIILKPEGYLMFQSATFTIIEGAGVFVKEMASASADVDGYGQLWIKNTDPTELWYTGDDGDDIQLTSGANRAGINPIISSMIFR